MNTKWTDEKKKFMKSELSI